MARGTDPAREEAILDAAHELLAEVGYDRTSIDQIAKRAGASKATIYRRWSGKPQLAIDVICRRLDSENTPLADGGDLRTDLRAMLGGYCRTLERKHTLILGLLPALIGDAELADALRTHVPGPDLDQIATVLRRARDRNELRDPPAPGELLTIVESLVWHRLLFEGRKLGRGFVDRSVDRVLLPLLRAWSD